MNRAVEVFQVSNTRFVGVWPIKGSLSYMVQECYQEPESPVGWYTIDAPYYTERSRSTLDAAQEWTRAQASTKDKKGA